MAVLLAHRSCVNGAELLADGRILSWSNDGSACIWDGRSPEPLTRMVGDRGALMGARLLFDGTLLTVSEDGTYVVWGPQTGAVLLAVSEREARDCHPALYRAWNGPSDSAGWPDAAGGRGMVALQLSSDALTSTLFWHIDGMWTVDHTFADGNVVAHRGGDLAFLHLHQGQRRIDLAEARALFEPGPSE